jgi:hypothetical protein
MFETIEIADQDPNGVLTVCLSDLLTLIGDVGPTLNWAILELEGVATLHDMLALEEEISSAHRGKQIEWKSLVELAVSLDEVLDATVVAFKSQSVPDFQNWQQLPLVCDVVIEAIDSSAWRVSAHDPALINRIAGAYHRVSRR